jgi:hypothetical protein
MLPHVLLLLPCRVQGRAAALTRSVLHSCQGVVMMLDARCVWLEGMRHQQAAALNTRDSSSICGVPHTCTPLLPLCSSTGKAL